LQRQALLGGGREGTPWDERETGTGASRRAGGRSPILHQPQGAELQACSAGDGRRGRDCGGNRDGIVRTGHLVGERRGRRHAQIVKNHIGAVDSSTVSEAPDPDRRHRLRTRALILACILLVAGAAAALRSLSGHGSPMAGSGESAHCGKVEGSPAGGSSPDEASARLFAAWQAGSCSDAEAVATPDAVRSLFAEPWSSPFQRPAGCFAPDEIPTDPNPMAPPGGVHPGEQVCNSPDGPWELQFWTAPNGKGAFVVVGIRMFHGMTVCRSTDPASCTIKISIKEVPASCPGATLECARGAAQTAGLPIAWIPESHDFGGYEAEYGVASIGASDRFAWQYMESENLVVYVASGYGPPFARIKVPSGLERIRRFRWKGAWVTEWAGHPPVRYPGGLGDVTWIVHFQWEWHGNPYSVELYRAYGILDPPLRRGLRVGRKVFATLRYASVPVPPVPSRSAEKASNFSCAWVFT
jgi:hypothetical protein